MRHRHVNNRHTFGMLLNRQVAGPGTGAVSAAGAACGEAVSVETAKRRQALLYGVPAAYWRLRHHHGFVMARPV